MVVSSHAGKVPPVPKYHKLNQMNGLNEQIARGPYKE